MAASYREKEYVQSRIIFLTFIINTNFSYAAHERATQKKKLRTELAQVKRENNAYLQKVEKAKMQRHIEERKVFVLFVLSVPPSTSCSCPLSFLSLSPHSLSLHSYSLQQKQQKRAGKDKKGNNKKQESKQEEEEAKLSVLKQKFRQRKTHNDVPLAPSSEADEKQKVPKKQQQQQKRQQDREDEEENKEGGEVSDDLLMKVFPPMLCECISSNTFFHQIFGKA